MQALGSDRRGEETKRRLQGYTDSSAAKELLVANDRDCHQPTSLWLGRSLNSDEKLGSKYMSARERKFSGNELVIGIDLAAT
jgi:hypothetical protein